MAITLNDNIAASAAKPLDSLRGPYTGADEATAKSAACAAIAGGSTGLRFVGRQVDLIIAGVSAVYVWESGIADADLVPLTTPLPQALGVGDSPTFAGITIAGANQTYLHKTGAGAGSALLAETFASSVSDVLNLRLTNPSGDQLNFRFLAAPLPTGFGNADIDLYMPVNGGYLALTSDIAAVAAGIHFKGKYATITALQTAVPTGVDGDYAIVTGSPDDQEFIWDSDHSSWVVTENVPASTFALLGGNATDNASLSAALSSRDTAIAAEASTRATNDTALSNAIALKADAALSFNDQTGTAYTLVLGDANKKVRMNNAAANSLNIPTNASVAFPVGTIVRVSMDGAGATSIVGASGVTVEGATTLIDVQYNEALLVKEATDTWRVVGILPNVSALDSPDGSIKRVSDGVQFEASILQAAGLGGCLQFNASSFNYVDVPVTGLPSSANDFTVSVIFKTSQSAKQGIIYLQDTVNPSHRFGLQVQSSGFNTTNSGSNGGNGTNNFCDGLWHLAVITMSSIGTYTLYVDNNFIETDSILASPNLVNSIGTIQIGFADLDGAGNYYLDGEISQVAIWTSLLNFTDRSAIWNSGSFTNSPPPTNLVRLYNFQDGIGTSALDDSTAHQTATLINGPNWLSTGNGAVPQGSSPTTSKYIEFSNGLTDAERGRLGVGDVSGSLFLRGLTVRSLINNTVPSVIGFDGLTLLSPGNTNFNARAKNPLDVAGAVVIGSGYATSYTAPPDGQMVQGRVVLGTTTDNLTDQLQVSGNINLITPGNKLKIATGTNSSVGKATLIAGTVTINTTAVGTGSIIQLTRNTPGGTIGELYAADADIVDGVSFVINSTNSSDISTVNYCIIN